MARPTHDTAPTAEELAAVTCPVDRYVAICRVARTLSTLPRPLAALRMRTLLEALALPGVTTVSLAARAQVSHPQVSRLHKRARLARSSATPQLAGGTS